MNYYDINMEHIKNYRDFMYKALVDAKVSTTSNRLENIELIDTRNGSKSIVIQKGLNRYRLNSSYNPQEEAKKWVSQFEFKNLHTVIAMYGFGNGVFAKEIISQMGKEDKLFIYEPSAQLLLFVLHHFDLTELITNPQIIIAIENINEFEFHHILLNSLDINNIHNQMRLTYPQYDIIFPESGILFWKELKDAHFRATVNINTQKSFGTRMIENTINNIKYIKNSNTITDLIGTIPDNLPAIVVAAGPSIGRQLEALKEAKGKSVIIAVDRILDYLLDNGIEPDFLVTIDPMKAAQYFSKRDDITIPLMCFVESNSEILDVHKGKKIICNSSDYLIKVYEDNGHIPPQLFPSASVATFAFTACIELGFKRIILVGQDLAYDGNSSHAGGIEEKLVQNNDVMMEGIHGDMIRSRFDWKMFITWYQDMLVLFPDLEVIDAKDKGAKIKGTKVMSLQEAMKLNSNQDIFYEFDINQLKPTFNQEEWENFGRYIEESVDVLDKIKSKAKEAINAFNLLIKECKVNLKSRIIDEKLRRIEKINNFIEQQPVYKLIDYYVKAQATQELTDIYQVNDNQVDDSVHTYERARCIFEAIADAADYLKPELEQVLEENF